VKEVILENSMPDAAAQPTELSPAEELQQLRQEVYNLSHKVQEYHMGNTLLLEALLHVTVQPEFELYRGRARSVLMQAGVMRTDGAPDWAALGARKAKPMTWEDAVHMFVKQPAEREHILSLADEPGPFEGCGTTPLTPWAGHQR
jgi:hypothetical protein